MSVMGRPSKYTDDIPEKMIAFFDVPESYDKIIIKEIDRVSAQGATTKQVEYKLVPKKLPTFERFAHTVGVTYRTLRDWAEAVVDPNAEQSALKYPDFSHAYNVCKFLQKDFMIQNGLAGMYPPASYIFTAKNITDMADKTIVETNDGDLREKRDALDGWLDTIRNHTNNGADNSSADKPVLPSVSD